MLTVKESEFLNGIVDDIVGFEKPICIRSMLNNKIAEVLLKHVGSTRGNRRLLLLELYFFINFRPKKFGGYSPSRVHSA